MKKYIFIMVYLIFMLFRIYPLYANTNILPTTIDCESHFKFLVNNEMYNNAVYTKIYDSYSKDVGENYTKMYNVYDEDKKKLYIIYGVYFSDGVKFGIKRHLKYFCYNEKFLSVGKNKEDLYHYNYKNIISSDDYTTIQSDETPYFNVTDGLGLGFNDFYANSNFGSAGNYFKLLVTDKYKHMSLAYFIINDVDYVDGDDVYRMSLAQFLESLKVGYLITAPSKLKSYLVSYFEKSTDKDKDFEKISTYEFKIAPKKSNFKVALVVNNDIAYFVMYGLGKYNCDVYVENRYFLNNPDNLDFAKRLLSFITGKKILHENKYTDVFTDSNFLKHDFVTNIEIYNNNSLKPRTERVLELNYVGNNSGLYIELLSTFKLATKFKDYIYTNNIPTFYGSLNEFRKFVSNTNDSVTGGSATPIGSITNIKNGNINITKIDKIEVDNSVDNSNTDNSKHNSIDNSNTDNSKHNNINNNNDKKNDKKNNKKNDNSNDKGNTTINNNNDNNNENNNNNNNNNFNEINNNINNSNGVVGAFSNIFTDFLGVLNILSSIPKLFVTAFNFFPTEVRSIILFGFAMFVIAFIFKIFK